MREQTISPNSSTFCESQDHFQNIMPVFLSVARFENFTITMTLRKILIVNTSSCLSYTSVVRVPLGETERNMATYYDDLHRVATVEERVSKIRQY